MILRAFLLALLALCFSAAASVAEDSSTWTELPGRWLEDAGSLLLAPAGWSQAEWRNAGLFSVGALGLYLLDEEIDDGVQRNRGGFTDNLADFGKNFGEPWLLLSVSGGLWLAGSIGDDTSLAETGQLALESYLFTTAAVLGIKRLGRRHRPNSGDGGNRWEGPGFSDHGQGGDPDGFSFPSGHAAGSFAVASVLVERHPEQTWLPWTAYGLAGLTAYSRLNDREHWASDVVVGTALGWAVGKGVARLRRGAGEVALVPVGGEGVAGVALCGRF